MPGRLVAVPWQDRVVDAFVPDPIAGVSPVLTSATIRLTERAAAAVTRLRDREALGLEAAARLLLRSEGVASSFIEGVRADVAEVAIAQAGGRVGDAPAWVADNLAAVDQALEVAGPLTAAAVRAWHRTLMAHSDLDAGHVGAWRDRQGWVGGASPLTAAFVPTPAGEIERLMADVVAFANRDDVDPVTHAALLHAQFETIHPFADGNGRVGRILVAWTLKRRLGVPVPPAVSVQFAQDIGGYISGLILYRQDRADLWISWFAEAIERAATMNEEVLASIVELREEWGRQVGDLRSDATARVIVEHLVEHPVVNADTVARLTGASAQACRAALEQLAGRGIVTEITRSSFGRPGRPGRYFVADGLLALLRR